MNENGIALMERIDRSFVERIRSAATSEKRGVGALVDAYRYLKTVTLKKWEVRILSRFRDPLAAALACWKRKADRAVFDIRALLTEIVREAEPFPDVAGKRGVRVLPWAEFSRKQRERMMSARRILYGATGACPAGD